MTFPSIEQYGEALQFPENTILDPKLRTGRVQTDTLGLPWGRSGAFALTFKISSQGANFAFRCFQSQRDSMHERYEGISKYLSTNKVSGFVHFRYLDEGIKIQRVNYPAVIMDWASGQSLGSYIEENLQDEAKLAVLQGNIEKLAIELENAGIAHGDIQSQNILVDSTGQLALVDYDGMFVPTLAKLKAIESGHRNFQHPQREKLLPFDSTLDRFPFALLHTSIGALKENPKLWDEFKCHPEKILFSSKDLQTPGTSKIFRKLAQSPALSKRSQQIAAFAKARYDQTPKFTEYLQGVQPQVLPSTSQGAEKTFQPWYMNPDEPISAPSVDANSHLPVLDAREADKVTRHAGQRVQLVGKIIHVELGESGKGLPHAILNVMSANQLSVQVAIWAEGLKSFAESGITIYESWVNGWISVTGDLSSILGSSSGSYVRLTITQADQLERISHQKATYLIKNSDEDLKTDGLTNEETFSRNENLITSLGSTKSSSSAPKKGAGSKTYATAPVNTRAIPPSKKFLNDYGTGLVIVLVSLFVVFAVVIAILINNAASGDVSGSDEIRETSEIDTNGFSAPMENFAGACLTSSNLIVDCSDPSAQTRVISTVDPNSSCPTNTSAVRRAEGWVCTTPLTEASVTAIALETCTEISTLDGPLRECFPGEGWEYSSCWNVGSGAMLQQRIKGTWETVKSNIATKNNCAPGFPWTVEFTRKASGVGVKQYRLFFPASDLYALTIEPIKVIVKRA